jgi:pantetheine-phosphate adenylyltransferase
MKSAAEKPFKYDTIALGGTFDNIHKGHEALFARAFQTGEHVVVGLTSDDFASSSGKKIKHTYAERLAQMNTYLGVHYPGREYKITQLNRTFGPGMFTSNVQAIVVSTETAGVVDEANKKRRELGLQDLKVEIVPIVLADDGKKISSTRIRLGEINEKGSRNS